MSVLALNDFSWALEQVFSESVPLKFGYYEIPSALFSTLLPDYEDKLPEVSLFKQTDGGKVHQIKDASEPYSIKMFEGVQVVLLKEEDFDTIYRFASSQILSPRAFTEISPEDRMQILRKSAISVVGRLYENPSPERITKSTRVVSSFVHTLAKEPETFFKLSKLASHDPYTLQHSVGTAVNCIILAQKCGVRDEKDLEEVGQAGLLHDIGKVKVKQKIILKPTQLDEKEWQEMKKHSEYSYDLIKDHPLLSERTKLAVRDHHEYPLGNGYPRGLKGDSVSLFARIVTISDILNALTTDRPYSKGLSNFEAFKVIQENLMTKVDPKLLNELILIYGGQTG